jgi:hypothetical protein
MDPLVDQATGPVATDQNAVPPDVAAAHSAPGDADNPVDSSPSAEGGLADIESELYCSTREMGYAAVSFGPVGDG